MKTIIYILLFNISAISFSQNPQLFDNDWYLQKINIDGLDYMAPSNDEVGFVPFYIYPDSFNTIICGGLAGHELTISSTEINVFEFVMVPDEPCYLPENNVYAILYYNGFFEWQFLDKTFSYIIENEGVALSLVLTNDKGDQAFYGNEPLAVQDWEASQFSIYPNPAIDVLVIRSQMESGKLTIKIFNMEGKLLSLQNLDFEKQVSVDVSDLSSGIYFLNIEDEEGNTAIKKFVKE